MALFRSGCEYSVKTTFEALRSSFAQGEVLIFTSDAYSRYDSCTGFFFYDPLTGEVKAWDVHDSERPEEMAPLYFELIGGWGLNRSSPSSSTIQPPELSAPALGLHAEEAQKELQTLVPYLKSLVEGHEGIESWYVWFKRTAPQWARILKRAQFLRLKHKPFSEACTILNALGVPYTVSPKYGWIDLCV
jgi:hypothetical protein